MPRTIPTPERAPSLGTYTARTPNGRLVIADLDTNPNSPLQRALRAAHLTPEPETP